MYFQNLKMSLEWSWRDVVANHGGTERAFLRELHGIFGLRNLSLALNSDLLPLNRFATLTSIWIDHTPQCWFGSSAGVWKKPSCELSDLLVISWSDHRKLDGKALLIQAKMANEPSIILKGKSTSVQIKFLTECPKFLLSNSAKGTKNANPSPYVNSGDLLDSIFCLAEAGRSKEEIDHSRFLQIKKKSAKKWLDQESSWATVWPLNPQKINGYARTLAEMVVKAPGSAGRPFQRNSKRTDWDRLVNLLIDSTISKTGRYARGPLQNNVSFCGKDDFLRMFGPGDYLLELDRLQRTQLQGDGRIGNLEGQYNEISGEGISTLFVTPFGIE